jgi:hypothetical protein
MERRQILTAGRVRRLLLLLMMMVAACAATAEVRNATPSDYRAVLRTLRPGDTLKLAPGRYSHLPVVNVNGTPESWITITGPESGPPAEIIGREETNTVEIYNSSYVAIERLRINSRGIPGTFGIAAHGGENNRVHDVRIEGNLFIGQNGGQQTVAISTKAPTWGWVIRNNQILSAGTGLYLGNSDGTDPFVAGVIENNLIRDTIGYNMQIKEQIYIPPVEGMPAGPTTTIIRHNVFIKNDGPSPDGDRPNLLLGGFPAVGAGSLNMYEVYGNYFVHNHREALLQATGRVSVHDNLFVDGPYGYPAVVFRSHQTSPLKIAYFYHNTVYTLGKGVYFGTRAAIDDAVMGNVVLADATVAGQVMRKSNNITDLAANAAKYLRAPSLEAGAGDFYPLPGKCLGPPVDIGDFHTDTDYARDFNGALKTAAKGAVVFRGAYAGEGTNEGWALEAAVKPASEAGDSPSLVWMSPASAGRGTVKPVTLTGTGFGEGAAVEIGGTGVKVRDVKVDGPTRILVTVEVAAGAPSGARDVSVSTAGGKSNSLAFRVTAGTTRTAAK